MIHTFIPSRDEEPVLDGIDEFIFIIFCSLLNFLNINYPSNFSFKFYSIIRKNKTNEMRNFDRKTNKTKNANQS